MSASNVTRHRVFLATLVFAVGAGEWLAGRMGAIVRLQIPFGEEAPFAQGALERLLFVVHIPCMRAEGALAVKGFVAIGAGPPSLARARVLVARQVELR